MSFRLATARLDLLPATSPLLRRCGFVPAEPGSEPGVLRFELRR